MRIFEMLQELELWDGERLIGVYVPGVQYNCTDDNHALTTTLNQWISEGCARVVEQREGGAQFGDISGQGEVR